MQLSLFEHVYRIGRLLPYTVVCVPFQEQHDVSRGQVGASLCGCHSSCYRLLLLLPIHPSLFAYKCDTCEGAVGCLSFS